MARFRVVQVITSTAARYGGPQRIVRDLCDALVERGHALSLVTTDLDGPERSTADSVIRAFSPSVDVAVARTVWPRSYGFSPLLIGNLRRRLPAADVVHIHGIYQFHTVAACTLARRYSVPYVINIHGALTRYHRSKKRWKKVPYEILIERRNIEGAAAVIALTEVEREAFTAWLPGIPCFVVPPVIDASLFAAGDLTKRAKRRLPQTSMEYPLVTFIGRLTEKKGLDLLVDAFGQLLDRYPGARLVIAGPDDEGIGQQLRRQAARIGIADRVLLTGLVTGERKRELLEASQLAALPSKDESFGVAIAEALTVGVPAVVTRGVALSRDILDAEAGMVADRDSTAFADAMADLLANDRMRSEMSANAQQLATESFSREAVVTKLEKVYAAVSGQDGGSNGSALKHQG